MGWLDNLNGKGKPCMVLYLVVSFSLNIVRLYCTCVMDRIFDVYEFDLFDVIYFAIIIGLGVCMLAVQPYIDFIICFSSIMFPAYPFEYAFSAPMHIAVLYITACVLPFVVILWNVAGFISCFGET